MTGTRPGTGLLAAWPVEHAALAVLGRDGVLATEGPLDRVFWLASLTKPLAALAALVAVEEEAVALDAPLAWPAAVPPELPEALAGATLRHLLAHASGLAPDRLERAAPVGTRRIYSNAGFDLIAAVLTEATDIAFADYLAEAVFGPLGMSTARLAGSAARDGHASVADWVPVLAELLAPGRLLDPATAAAASTVQFPGLAGVLPGYGSQADNAWGLGLEIRAGKQPHWTSAKNSAATYGHFGQSGTMFWVDPAAGLAVVALADRPFRQWAARAWPVLSAEVLRRYG